MIGHVRGNAKAPVVLVEYADFECPYCAMAYPIVKSLMPRFGDDLAEVFRPFPLIEIHPHAMHAAQAAEAAGLQRKFWGMHDALFENQQQLDDRSLLVYATKLGLDIDKFTEDFASRATIASVTRSMRLGAREGVRGTPTFFLNGEMLELENYEDLVPIVRAAIEKNSHKQVKNM